ncbi:MAG: EamA family transporter, partial [Eubacterium sp.]
ALLGALGGAGAGFAYTCVRRLGKGGVHGSVIVLAFSAFSCISVIPGVLLTYAPMTAFQFVSLLLAGAAAAGGQFSITAAYTKAPAKEISVFDYTQVLFAALLSLCVLGQVPDLLSIAGYVIIIGTAVFKWKKGLKKKTM